MSSSTGAVTGRSQRTFDRRGRGRLFALGQAGDRGALSEAGARCNSRDSTLHLRLLDGRLFFSVLAGACRFGTAPHQVFALRAQQGEGAARLRAAPARARRGPLSINTPTPGTPPSTWEVPYAVYSMIHAVKSTHVIMSQFSEL